MSMELDAHHQRRKAALSLFAPPVAPSDVPEIKTVHGAARYQSIGPHCRVVFMYESDAPEGHGLESFIFETQGMDKESIARKALSVIIAWIAEKEFNDLRLYVEQKGLLHAINVTGWKSPSVAILGSSHKNNITKVFTQELTRTLNRWLVSKTGGAQEKKAVPSSVASIGTPLSIYIEPWTDTPNRRFGVGYVIQETLEEGPSPRYQLRFGSFIADASSKGSDTVAALRAIHGALKSPEIMGDETVFNGRPLKIHSSDAEAVRILNALKNKKQKSVIASEIGAVELNAGLAALSQRRKGVIMTFEAVEGYVSNPLSFAANRLGTAVRRNNDMEMPEALRKNMRDKIIADAVTDLENLGIEVEALL